MKKFEISRIGPHRFYYSPLFIVVLSGKATNPVVIFSNGEDSLSVFISRSELAVTLRTNFKNHPTRLREKSEKTLKKLA